MYLTIPLSDRKNGASLLLCVCCIARLKATVLFSIDYYACTKALCIENTNLSDFNRILDIVHAYEITEDTFKAAWKYLTSLLDRLMCYKISARRWVDDVINPNEDFRSVCGKLVDIMVWQTKSLEERDEIYLVLKNNRRLQAAEVCF